MSEYDKSQTLLLTLSRTFILLRIGEDLERSQEYWAWVGNSPWAEHKAVPEHCEHQSLLGITDGSTDR